MALMMAIDQSTAGTKVLLIDENGQIRHKVERPHRQIYPQPGWVEHDAEEIWQNVLALASQLPTDAGIGFSQIIGLALTNQRETTIAWDRQTGQPLAPAVVWQCQRGEAVCRRLEKHSGLIRQKTGLTLSAYYPAAKAAWLLEHIPDLQDRAKNGKVCIGTVDSYLLFRLTGGQVFATDMSNASRTQLFNLDTLAWDQDIAGWFGIPLEALPQVLPSDSRFGYTAPGLLPHSLPIAGIMGDSHAALFGQGCISEGMAKATYGTGSSIMLNAGRTKAEPPEGIAASLAWGWRGEVHYVLEGNVTSSGDTLKWICDELELVKTVREIDDLSELVEDTNGAYLVPAFSGLGAPYFDSGARAALIGLSRGTRKAHVARAALESIAYQNDAVVTAMGVRLQDLRADGGPTRSDVLMQFQADLLGCPVRCNAAREISALGAAYMGGLTLGFYDNLQNIPAMRQQGRTFMPRQPAEYVSRLRAGWQDAVRRVRS